MSFVITYDVPESFNWSPIQENYRSYLLSINISNGSDDLSEHFAYLLRATSWSFGIDWNVKAGEVTVELPFDGPLTGVNTIEDSVDVENQVSIDGMSRILKNILAKVPPSRVQSHFKQFRLAEAEPQSRVWGKRPFSSGLYGD